MSDEIKPIAPGILQIMKTHIGKYMGEAGLDKFFHLMNAIDLGIQHIGEDFFWTRVEDRLKKYREFEKQTNLKTMASHVKGCDEIKIYLDNFRIIVNDLKIAYDEIKEKDMRGKTDIPKIIEYKKRARMVTPYQPILYFVFDEIMKITNLQSTTIPPEMIRSPQLAKFTHTPFAEKRKEMSPEPKSETTQ